MNVIDQFNADVLQHGGYRYVEPKQLSCRLTTQTHLRRLLSAIPEGTRTLIDYGCGDGTYTLLLGDALPRLQITGVDGATEAIALANHRKQQRPITFMVGNIDGPVSAHCNVALLHNIVHHLDHPAAAIHHIAASCDWLIIIEPNGSNPVLKLVERFSQYHRQHQEKSYPLSTVVGWLCQARLKVLSIQYFGFVPVLCPAWLAFLLRACQPVIERLPVVRRFACGSYLIVAWNPRA